MRCLVFAAEPFRPYESNVHHRVERLGKIKREDVHVAIGCKHRAYRVLQHGDYGGCCGARRPERKLIIQVEGDRGLGRYTF